MAEGSLWEMTSFARVVTLIGAGGKSTALNTLTQEIFSRGKKVVSTTTTKVYPMPFESIWQSLDSAPDEEKLHPCFWFGYDDTVTGKWIGLPPEVIDDAIARDTSRRWVIEGDGARECSLKCWDTHEPQIPTLTECAVLILPARLWGKRLNSEEIHRPELCLSFVGREWNNDIAWNYFLSSPVFYPNYREMSWVIVLNEVKNDQGNNDQVIDEEGFSLEELKTKGQTLFAQALNHSSRPQHLRLAAGSLKEGYLRWCDLW